MEGDVVSVLIGRPASSVSWMQVAMVSVASILGLANLFWAIVLARQTRRRSTDDEFWFRKVVGPSVIDKAVEFSSVWGAALGGAHSMLGDSTKASHEIMKCKEQAEIILRGCVCLKLYNLDAYAKATAHIDCMVDQVTECLHAISSPVMKPNEMDRMVDNRQRALNDSFIKLLRDLKELQSSF